MLTKWSHLHADQVTPVSIRLRHDARVTGRSRRVRLPAMFVWCSGATRPSAFIPGLMLSRVRASCPVLTAFRRPYPALVGFDESGKEDARKTCQRPAWKKTNSRHITTCQVPSKLEVYRPRVLTGYGAMLALRSPYVPRAIARRMTTVHSPRVWKKAECRARARGLSSRRAS